MIIYGIKFIIFEINFQELNDLKAKIERLAPNIDLKTIDQNKISFYLLHSSIDLEKRIEHVSGMNK